MSASEPRRVSREQARAVAAAAGGAKNYFRLPQGWSEWYPDKAATFEFDIIPFVVSVDNHPDKIEKGFLWYRFPFNIHRNVGPNNEYVVCPASLGLPCPGCEERVKLGRNKSENKDAMKALYTQKFMAYPMIDPRDKAKYAMFIYSRAKFADQLDKEMEEGDPTNLDFYEVTDQGRTLKARFSEEDFTPEGGGTIKFLEASRIDFIPRRAMDQAKIFAATNGLESWLQVLPYEKLHNMFFQTAAPATTGEIAAPRRSREKPDAPAAAEPAPSPVREARAATGGTFAVGDTISFTHKGEKCTGKVAEVNTKDQDIVTSVGGKRVIVDFDDATLVADEAPAAPATSAPARSKPEGVSSAGYKKDDLVTVDYKGKMVDGKIIQVRGDDLTIEDKEGDEYDVKITAVQTGTAGGKAAPAAEPAKAKAPIVGDDVEWEDSGDRKEGEVIEIHKSKPKAKVKLDNGEELWVQIEALKVI